MTLRIRGGKVGSRTRRPFALVMIDVDDFKAINDTHGHDCGDLVLKTIADVLRGSVRKMTGISRWGGDEFLLLFPETDLEGARAAAENIGNRVAQTVVPWKGKDLAVRISLGISVFRDGMEIDDVLREADQEMYERKRASKSTPRSQRRDM
jgi:diguanylate cyclase (GGDEF)-like protein